MRDLVAAVRSAHGRVSRTAIERELHQNPQFEPVDELGKPRWRYVEPVADTPDSLPVGQDAEVAGQDRCTPARAGATQPAHEEDNAKHDTNTVATSGRAHNTRTAATSRRANATRTSMAAMEPRAWQAEALAAWSQTGRGVIEAVTGTGKTRLAMLAIRMVIDGGGRVLVLAPTLELQQQWQRELRTLLPDVTVGRLGGGGDDDLFARQVVVATPHSAAAVPVDLPPGALGLLVADEAHRYGAPTWGSALSDEFALRLALTATYERADDGVADVLGPYFGPVVYAYGYQRAVADGVVAPFRIGLAKVALTDAEQQRYDSADTRVRQLHRELIGPFKMPREPRALLTAVTAVVSEAEAKPGADGPQTTACREYLVRVRQRREVAATADAKLQVLGAAADGLAGARTLVFSDTVDQAHEAALMLVRHGVHAETLHGGLDADKRRIRLAQFRKGNIEALVAPRVLDEGVDVPDADVALVLAAFRSRRHLVQRLGRVLRRKEDGREARLVLTFAAGTAEDPSRGGHAGFLEQVGEVARSVDHLDVDANPSAVAGWLTGQRL